MSAHGLLNSVFSCSSMGSKTVSKRKLRQSRSLDPALIRYYGTESGDAAGELTLQMSLCLNSSQTGGIPYFRTSADYLAASKIDERSKTLSGKQHLSSSSLFTPLDALSRSDIQLDCDVKNTKRNTARDIPFSLRRPLQSANSGSGTIFSPRKWLQKRTPHADNFKTSFYNIWRSEGDFTWRSECGRCFHLMPVPLQSLSELERVRLQDVAFVRLIEDYDLGCQITIPKDGRKRKKSLRSKLDSLGKEKKDKEYAPQAFGVSLQQVIANDRWFKLRQEAQEQKDPADLGVAFLHLARQRLIGREISSSNSSLSSCCDTPNESTSPGGPESGTHTRRRGGVSVDCITDLDDGRSRLLEALQLSLPAETLSKKEKARDKKLSLNPIYRQVPRIVDCCCQHLEIYGLQTVGIFRVGSSKKRVRQLREEFDQGIEVALGPEHSVHDVASLLKEFLRDMPDPLLTRELYSAFINCTLLSTTEQNTVLQLLVCLLPACNSDTLQRLLCFLSMVAACAEDSHDRQGEQITGNKMTSHNLATVLGPNILHKQKSSDKEFSVQTSAQVEDSGAIISIVQRMITWHEALFMVPPELQHEVLVSLVETDYDVVDYLLRRRASQKESPTISQLDEPLCLNKRGSSSDSSETSPYDNDSPTMPHRLPPAGSGLPGPQRSPERHMQPSRAESALTPGLRHVHNAEAAQEKSGMWDSWHPTLKTRLHDQEHTGSDGNLSEYVFSSSPKAYHSHHGNMKRSLRRTLTTPAEAESRPHPHVTRANSSPLCESLLDQMWKSLPTTPWQYQTKSPFHQSDEIIQAPPIPSLSVRHSGRLPPPYPGLPNPISTSMSPSAKSQQPADASLRRSRGLHSHGPPSSQGAPPTSTRPQTDVMCPPMGEYRDWQTDKWQIWQLLSSENADTLPETLV